MVEAKEATEEDIEVEVDTEEITKEIIKKHQTNKLEIMVQNQQGERNHENQGQPQQR